MLLANSWVTGNRVLMFLCYFRLRLFLGRRCSGAGICGFVWTDPFEDLSLFTAATIAGSTIHASYLSSSTWRGLVSPQPDTKDPWHSHALTFLFSVSLFCFSLVSSPLSWAICLVPYRVHHLPYMLAVITWKPNLVHSTRAKKEMQALLSLDLSE